MSNADLAGADAAARHAIAVLNHASATGDVTEWTSITLPSCETCAGFTADIAAAGPDSGGTIAVETSKPTEIDPGVFYTVTLIINQMPYTNPDGSESAGGRFALLMAIRFTDRWIVEAMDIGTTDAPWAS